MTTATTTTATPAADIVIAFDKNWEGRAQRTPNKTGHGDHSYTAHANIDHKGKGYRAAVYQTGRNANRLGALETMVYLNGRAIPENQLQAIRAELMNAYRATFGALAHHEGLAPAPANAPRTLAAHDLTFLGSGMGARITHGRVTLQIEGNEYELTAPGAAPHRLAISQTDAPRLNSHWQAYCAAHAADKVPAATPAPETVETAPTAPAANLATVRTIDLTPTWSDILPMLLAAYDHATFDGRKAALGELTRMAATADKAVADAKAKAARAANPAPRAIVIADLGDGETEAFGPFDNGDDASRWGFANISTQPTTGAGRAWHWVDLKATPAPARGALPDCFRDGHTPSPDGRTCLACGQAL